MKLFHFAVLLILGAAIPHDAFAAVLPQAVTDADYRPVTGRKAELGRLLMYDKILSGNRNISCATCHHALTDTGDGLSLPVGEGGRGLGVNRSTGHLRQAIHERVPRNSPPLFNLGAREFQVLFHDGRVSANAAFPSRCQTPAGHRLPAGLDNVLACQAMFPVTSTIEMAGQKNENRVARAAAAGRLDGPDGVWELIAGRIRRIPEYVRMFRVAFDDVRDPGDIRFTHVANAIAAYESAAWRSDNSPFDRYLRGEQGAMSGDAVEGMYLFYLGNGVATSCGDCHSGKYQTDHRFHAVAMPQIGPGRGSNSAGKTGGVEDFGREQVTGDAKDRLKFRTPSLRNVAVTAPYGHSGAYDSLRAVIMHHLDPVAALYGYDRSQAVLPSRADLDALDFITMSDPDRVAAIAAGNEIRSMPYTSAEVDRIIDFLHALTDPDSLDLRHDVPAAVPSGLPVYD
jgi:cytochrome c peroxidase